MPRKTTIAIIYDFDRTLSRSEMQDDLLKDLGTTPADFWDLSKKFAKKNNMDAVLAYLHLIVKECSKKEKPLDREVLREYGKKIEYHPGVKGWFKSINEIAESLHINIEHYIISSGLKEILEGTSIYNEFKEVYACEYYYNENGVPVWIKNVVNFTSKTQFLFRINKGVLDIWDTKGVNEYMEHEKRPIPFDNIIYIGDGDTDIPCMKLVKQNRGHSIAVYSDDDSTAKKLRFDDRIDFYCKADYTKKGELYSLVNDIIHQIHYSSPLRDRSDAEFEESKNSILGKKDGNTAQ